MFHSLSPCLGFFAPTPFTLFSHDLLQQPLYFLNSFESTLIFKSLEEHYDPKHYVLHSHSHITLCSARLLLGTQEMLFSFKKIGDYSGMPIKCLSQLSYSHCLFIPSG